MTEKAKTQTIPELCKRKLKGLKLGGTAPELATKTGATLGTTRRSITRLIARNEATAIGTRKCRQTGKTLMAYSLPTPTPRRRAASHRAV